MSVSGAACRVAREEMAADTAHVRRLSRRLVEGIRAQLEHVVFNGDEANTYDGCVNLSFAYVEVSLFILAVFLRTKRLLWCRTNINPHHFHRCRASPS